MFVELCLVVLLMLYLWLFVFKSRTQNMYSKFPGPKPYPIIGNLLEFDYTKEEITETFKKLSFKYGPAYLLTLGQEYLICLRDPSLIEMVYSYSNTFLDKPPMFNILEPLLKQGLFTSQGDQWREQRKLLNPTFHIQILGSFVPIFERNGALLVKKLLKHAEKEFDVMPLVAPCTLDMICEAAMGFQVNAQQGESKYIDALEELTEIIANRSFSFLQRSFLFPLLPTGRRHNELIAYIHGVTDTIIKERKIQYSNIRDNGYSKGSSTDLADGLKRRKPFLDLLLEYNMEGAGLSDKDLQMQVISFMIGGHDTVQTLVSFALYSLSQHPEVQEKAYKEIVQILKDKNQDATLQDLQNMRYLEKVIKETLRLYPSAQFIGRKADEDLDLRDGYVIPKNSTVLLLVEAMHRDPELFPEPLKFDPERYGRDNMHPFSFLPFGAGVRNCIGQRYAMLATKSVISRVLRSVQLLPSDIPVNITYRLALKSSTGVNLKVVPRSN